jgi:hypothetical protein
MKTVELNVYRLESTMNSRCNKIFVNIIEFIGLLITSESRIK